MIRYNLRSAQKSAKQISFRRNSNDKQDTDLEPTNQQQQYTLRDQHRGDCEPCRKKVKISSVTFFSLPPEMVLHIGAYLDTQSLMSLYQTCHSIRNLLDETELFWKMVCVKEELNNYDCLLQDDGHSDKVGFSGKPMRIVPDKMSCEWKKIFQRGLQMRKNILACNYEGWRIFANKQLPMTRILPTQDLLALKKSMGDVPKLSSNDDLKIDWDEKYLVIFHFFRSHTESSTIWVFDMENEPKFLYSVDKGTNFVTDKVFVHKGHVVIVPSWPLTSGAVVMTLSIANQMEVVGKFLFEEEEKQSKIDQLWMHTVLRVVKDVDQALVVCRTPTWECLVVQLPSCNLLKSINLTLIPHLFDCQQIRSHGTTAVILFVDNQNDSVNKLSTIDVLGKETQQRSVTMCNDIVDVALFPGAEAIYLLKKYGDVVLYDAATLAEEIKISNSQNHPALSPSAPDYQMFVNPNEEICLLQSATDVDTGRFIKVYDFSGDEKYHINLDMWEYGLSRDESLCMYTNGAFLTVANSQKLLLFSVKSGKYMGFIPIPTHMERAKGKENSACMFEPTGLNLLIFDEDKMVAVHDYERTFPSVLDIYKFW